jgi:hypothetical protein
MNGKLIKMTCMTAPMKQLPAHVRHAVWIAATLLLATSPAAAQTATPSVLGQAVNPNGQQLLGTRSARQVTPQAPTTGTFCIEEMTATFCNVPTGPNTNGYGSVGGGSASGGRAASGSGSAASSSAGVNTSSLPPCMREPAANELCN